MQIYFLLVEPFLNLTNLVLASLLLAAQFYAVSMGILTFFILSSFPPSVCHILCLSLANTILTDWISSSRSGEQLHRGSPTICIVMKFISRRRRVIRYLFLYIFFFGLISGNLAPAYITYVMFSVYVCVWLLLCSICRKNYVLFFHYLFAPERPSFCVGKDGWGRGAATKPRTAKSS